MKSIVTMIAMFTFAQAASAAYQYECQPENLDPNSVNFETLTKICEAQLAIKKLQNEIKKAEKSLVQKHKLYDLSLLNISKPNSPEYLNDVEKIKSIVAARPGVKNVRLEKFGFGGFSIVFESTKDWESTTLSLDEALGIFLPRGESTQNFMETWPIGYSVPKPYY